MLSFLRVAYSTKKTIGQITEDPNLRQKEFEESDLEIKIIKDLIMYMDKYVDEEVIRKKTKFDFLFDFYILAKRS
jgi:hypothetical protein